MVIVIIFVILVFIYCHQGEKTTVVRFSSPPPGRPSNCSGLLSLDLEKHSFKPGAIDNRELIRPKVKLYERSRESTPYYDILDGESIPSRALQAQGSSRPVSSVSSISQAVTERRISLLSFPHDNFDTDSRTCFENESRESTPIRPLDPAYECQGPLNISNSSFVPPFLLRENELTLPPGYVSFNDGKF